MVSVGIAIIARDEEKTLPALLASIEGAFDRAVLLDTGSTDATIDVFAAWAKNQTGMTFSVASWEWENDFAAARNAADRLLLYGSTQPSAGTNGERPMVDWRSWADCDDTISGATNLRQVVENADPRVTAFFAGYNYAQDENGQCVIYLRRERLVRSDYRAPWVGRVHEATPIENGAVMNVPTDVVEWVHRKQQVGTESNDRNLAILEQWNQDEPGNSRIVGYLGVENMVRGEFDKAIAYFREYKTLNSAWDEEHAQICRKLAQCLMITERPKEALQAGFDGLQVHPTWPDNYLTLAEAYYFLGEHSKSLAWSAQVTEAPSTMLIINPMDYSFLPKKLQSLALGDSGQFDRAIELGNEALAMAPGDQFLQMKMNDWRKVAKREHTASTVVMMADQLVGHDEQLKAMILLESCVPHFAMEHPQVVAARARVRERLRWANKPGDYAEHYETGGSKPEDFIKEENINPLCEYLPRTNFLLEGLREQLETA